MTKATMVRRPPQAHERRAREALVDTDDYIAWETVHAELHAALPR